MPSKILVTGADGMLGRAVCKALGPSALGFSRSECDVTDAAFVQNLASEKFDAIVHCAGDVNADRCEVEQDFCYNVHVNGTQNILDLASTNDAKVVYPQSFLIFDGTENPITEATKPNPLSWYGHCKMTAGELVRQHSSNHLVIQMGGFFGGDAKDKNFVGKFIPHVIEQIKAGETEMKVGDRVWQPTYTKDLAENVQHLLNADEAGTFNMACHGRASFFELARECLRILELENRFTVRLASAAEFGRKEPAERPEQAYMENARLAEHGLDKQRQWEVALKEYLSSPYFRQLTTHI